MKPAALSILHWLYVTDGGLSVLYTLHIVAGGLALASGLVALISKKGRTLHRLAGRLFVVAMITIAISATVLALVRPNNFLLFLGLFSAYLALSGRLALTRKRLPTQTPAPRSHWFLPGAMMIVSLGFAIVVLTSGNPLFGVFVGLGLLRSYTDLSRMRTGYEERLHWLIEHQFSMGTAFIASLTAFVVVNLGRLGLGPLVGYLGWLLPTAIGVPLLIRSTRRYRQQDSPPA